MFKSKKPSKALQKGTKGKETRPEEDREVSTASGQHSILPADLTVTDNLVSTGDIRIEGVVHGDITCRVLTLTGEPHIEGTVKAESVHVVGTFRGTLKARTVILTKAARMSGEICYETLEIAPGARFEGSLSRLKT